MENFPFSLTNGPDQMDLSGAMDYGNNLINVLMHVRLLH